MFFCHGLTAGENVAELTAALIAIRVEHDAKIQEGGRGCVHAALADVRVVAPTSRGGPQGRDPHRSTK